MHKHVHKHQRQAFHSVHDIHEPITIATLTSTVSLHDSIA